MPHSTRRRFLASSAAAGAALALPIRSRAQGANEAIRVGLIGCGGRGNELLGQLLTLPDVRVAAVCDPDSKRAAETAARAAGAATHADLRRLLDDKSVDAVVVATCNHWHCLAAAWACQAGKDVYCEKPLSHSLWEGRRLVEIANAEDRLVQVGTQQRSDPLQAEVKQFLHDDKGLGKILGVVVPRFGVRASIGKRNSPMTPPAEVDYNLWLGPAQDEPILRNNFHYDWHWVWNTGDGECGNWGVHLLDDVVNVVFRDQHKLPTAVASGGARVAWNDAGQSPNFHLAYLKAGDVPVLFMLSNLPARPGENSPLRYENVDCGYVVHGENGDYHGWRGGGEVFDHAGKSLRKFRGDSGAGHMRNFFDAVRSHDATRLNAPVEIGHSSAGWAHTINAAFRAATYGDLSPHGYDIGGVVGHNALVSLVHDHLGAHGIAMDGSFRSSGLFTIDPQTEAFAGEGAEAANAILGQPKYRGEFAMPA